MNYRFVYILSFLYFSPIITCAQINNPDFKRIAHWYFGDSAGLDFSSGIAIPDTNGAMSVLERSATISDKGGNLLMYTDGKTVWNAQHQIMENGTDIGVGFYATPRDCSVIIPKPFDDSIYYIFTVDGWENQFQRGMRYSTIDMSYNSGLGRVIEKNHLLYTPCTEQLAACKSANACDYWVVSHERSTNNFRAYNVTSMGVDTVPVISASGEDYNIPQQVYSLNGGYHLRFSASGKKAAVQVVWNYVITDSVERIELHDFDTESGTFSNSYELPVDTSAANPFFSPDGLKLYFEDGFAYARLVQFDLSSGDSIVIQNSKTVVHSGNPYYGIALDGQIASDGKIYTTIQNIDPYPRDVLSVIENPNTLGVTCNVQVFQQSLNGRWSSQGLPNFVSQFLTDMSETICKDDGIIQIAPESSFILFPNPARNELTILRDMKNMVVANIEISDVYNKIYYQTNFSFSDELQLNTASIPNGMYLLTIRSTSDLITLPFIIQH